MAGSNSADSVVSLIRSRHPSWLAQKMLRPLSSILTSIGSGRQNTWPANWLAAAHARLLRMAEPGILASRTPNRHAALGQRHIFAPAHVHDPCCDLRGTRRSGLVPPRVLDARPFLTAGGRRYQSPFYRGISAQSRFVSRSYRHLPNRPRRKSEPRRRLPAPSRRVSRACRRRSGAHRRMSLPHRRMSMAYRRMSLPRRRRRMRHLRIKSGIGFVGRRSAYVTSRH